jgi:hypothetical protein
MLREVTMGLCVFMAKVSVVFMLDNYCIAVLTNTLLSDKNIPAPQERENNF